jgi:hypothetical protein
VLNECHRVLGPGGRAIFIVPSRAGLWSRSDSTPFGFGRPYSPGQLEVQLRAHDFDIGAVRATLYQPPSHHPVWRRTASLLERAGHMIPTLAGGGVLMVEACKQSPATSGPGLRARRRDLVLAPLPEAVPA